MGHRASVFVALCAAVLAIFEAGQAQPRTDRRVRQARRPIPNQYIVVLAEGADADEVVADTEVRHGRAGGSSSGARSTASRLG